MASARAGDLARECGVSFDTLRPSLHKRKYSDPNLDTLVSAKHADEIRKIFGTGPIVLSGASATERAASEIFGVAAGLAVGAREKKQARKAERAIRPAKDDPNVAWAYAFFEPAERDAWIEGGIGAEQVEVAERARAAGLTPAELRKKAGQRAVWQWLILGEDPKRVVQLLNHSQNQQRPA